MREIRFFFGKAKIFQVEFFSNVRTHKVNDTIFLLSTKYEIPFEYLNIINI